MKKVLIIIIFIFTCFITNAEKVKIGDLYYELNQSELTAEVTCLSETSPYAFSTVNIPPTVVYNDIEYSVTSIGVVAFRDCSSLTSVTIPNSVTYIGLYALLGCKGLTSVNIPNSVTTIDIGAFYGCKGLTSVTLGNSVTSIGNEAFRDCSGLTNVIIPNSVTTIWGNAFYGCKGLTSVTLGNSVTSIGYGAFYGCYGLKKVEISDLEAWCKIDFFDSDSNPLLYAEHLYLNGNEVKDLVIPTSVTSIGDYAFCSFSGLTSVTIPDSVTSIGKYAFYYCSGLKEIRSLSKTPAQTGDDAFGRLYYSIPLYVPSESISLYKNASEWMNFDTILPIINATGINLNQSTFSLFVGQSETLIATLTPEGASSVIIWSTDNDNIASIDQTGRVTALAIGNTIITANAGSLTATCKLRVNPTPASSITLNTQSMSLTEGQSAKLTATVYPENTTDPTVHWQSTNEEIAFVAVDGTVTALSVGTVNISATCGEAMATCVVNVNSHISASSITLNLWEMSLNVGQSEKLTATVYPDNTTNPTIQWQSTNEKIAKVSDDGTITAVSVGTVNISAICGDASATCVVRVNPAPGTVTIDDIYYNYNGTTAVVAGCASTMLQANIADKITLTFGDEDIEFAVVGIAENAFANHPKLRSVVLPSSITTIGADAFANCAGLTSISCYATNPPVCAYNAFSGTTCDDLHVLYFSLNSYKTAAVWKNFKNIYGDLDLYEYNKMFFLLDPQSLKGELVSVDKSLDKADIPEKITIAFEGKTYTIIAIDEGAFDECENINAVTIPSSIVTIDARIFDELKNLKNLTFSDGSELLYINGKINASSLEILTIGRELYFGEISIDEENFECNPVFSNVPTLTSLNFGKYIKTIVKGMFEGCTNLRSLTIPENVEFIGDKSFSGCVSLRSINLEDSSNSITIESATSAAGTGTTFGSAPIETIYLGRNVEYIGTELSPFKNLETLTTLTIGNKTTSINNYLFYGCRNIEMMSVPSSVTYIGGYSFYDCSAAKLLTISRSVETIGEYAFYNCRSLNTLTIPSSVVTIGDYAFRSCSGLASISIGDGVKTIGNYAFLDCYMASNITIGRSVQTIGENAFYNCQSWANIVIPNSVVNIGANAFALCQGAKEITIGLGVKSIGERAFADCDFITQVKSLSSVPPVAYDNTFTSYDATLYVPQTSLDSYRTSPCWKNFITIIDDLSVETPDSGIGTIIPEAEKLSIFNVKGILIKNDANQEDIDTLAPGIYILNGRKVVVK